MSEKKLKESMATFSRKIKVIRFCYFKVCQNLLSKLKEVDNVSYVEWVNMVSDEFKKYRESINASGFDYEMWEEFIGDLACYEGRIWHKGFLDYVTEKYNDLSFCLEPYEVLKPKYAKCVLCCGDEINEEEPQIDEEAEVAARKLNRPPKFAIGHNVNLECRLSLDMTVIGFEEDGGGYSYTCYWFDTYSHIQLCVFPEVALRLSLHSGGR